MGYRKINSTITLKLISDKYSPTASMKIGITGSEQGLLRSSGTTMTNLRVPYPQGTGSRWSLTMDTAA